MNIFCWIGILWINVLTTVGRLISHKTCLCPCWRVIWWDLAWSQKNDLSDNVYADRSVWAWVFIIQGNLHIIIGIASMHGFSLCFNNSMHWFDNYRNAHDYFLSGLSIFLVSITNRFIFPCSKEKLHRQELSFTLFLLATCSNMQVWSSVMQIAIFSMFHA